MAMVVVAIVMVGMAALMTRVTVTVAGAGVGAEAGAQVREGNEGGCVARAATGVKALGAGRRPGRGREETGGRVDVGGEGRAPEMARAAAATAVVLVQAKTSRREREGVSDGRKTAAIDGEALGEKQTQIKINTARVERDTRDRPRLDQGMGKRKGWELGRGGGANVRHGMGETAAAVGRGQATVTTSVALDAVEGRGMTKRGIRRWGDEARMTVGRGTQGGAEAVAGPLALRAEGVVGAEAEGIRGGVTRATAAPAIAALATGARTMEAVMEAGEGGKTFPGGAG